MHRAGRYGALLTQDVLRWTPLAIFECTGFKNVLPVCPKLLPRGPDTGCLQQEGAAVAALRSCRRAQRGAAAIVTHRAGASCSISQSSRLLYALPLRSDTLSSSSAMQAPAMVSRQVPALQRPQSGAPAGFRPPQVRTARRAALAVRAETASQARIVVQGRNVEATPAIKNFCEDKVGKAIKNFEGVKEVGFGVMGCGWCRGGLPASAGV